jgi:predicted NACHT family NTPase
VDISELLVESDRHIYQFSHLSFQEFLAASEIMRSQQEGLLYENLGLSTWKDTILFYGSLVNPTELLQETINRNAIDLGYQISKQSSENLHLMGAKKRELDTVKETIKTLRYKKLEEYLKDKEWQKADYETYRLMITSVGKYENQGFRLNDLRNFPCDALLAIDRLWVKYSDGLYGFSVQKQIYVECGGKLDFSYPSHETWEKFCDRTAWKSESKWLDYPDQFFLDDFTKVKGHLPSGVWVVVGAGGGSSDDSWWGEGSVRKVKSAFFLASRLVKCKP